MTIVRFIGLVDAARAVVDALNQRVSFAASVLSPHAGASVQEVEYVPAGQYDRIVVLE